MVKTSFDITVYFKISENGDYKFCILKINGSITKLFCYNFNASKVKSKLFNFPPNWLADEFFPSNCLPPNSYVACESGTHESWLP